MVEKKSSTEKDIIILEEISIRKLGLKNISDEDKT